MSKQQAKNIFKDGETKFQKKTMDDYTEVIYKDLDGVSQKLDDLEFDYNKKVGGTIVMTGYLDANSPAYPKPVPPSYIPNNGIIKFDWVKSDAARRSNSAGTAYFMVFNGETMLVHQETHGDLPVRMAVAQDKLTPQFNQTTGYWARIGYTATLQLK